MKYFEVAYGNGESIIRNHIYARGWRIDDEGVLFFYDDSNRDFRAFRTWITVGPA